MEILAWIGFSQSLFGATLVGTKSDSSLPDKILTVWLLLMAFIFLSLGIDIDRNSFTILTSSFLLFNPLLYLYASASTIKKFRIRWFHPFHLIPFLFFEIYSHFAIVEFLPGSFFEKDPYLHLRLIFSIINIISWFTYTTIALILVHKHKVRLKDELSTIDASEKLNWLLFISIFYTIYWIVLLVSSFTIVSIRVSSNFPIIYNYIVMLAMSFIITYYGVRQKEILKFFWKIKEQPVSNTDKERFEDVRASINKYLIDERGFSNPELNLQMLSDQTGFPKYLVTEVLNKDMSTNFFTYINGLRTQEAKRLLAIEQSKYSIEGIGYECGFKSRSSFYTFFKKETGMTPNEYRISITNSSHV